MIDTDQEHVLNYDWRVSQRLILPGNTKGVTIEAINPGNVGGILASFSNGVLTDATWQCADMSSCITVECENSVKWQSAKPYGVNGEHPWTIKLNEIESTAQWIWVDDDDATRVWCNKTFGKLIRIM